MNPDRDQFIWIYGILKYPGSAELTFGKVQPYLKEDNVPSLGRIGPFFWEKKSSLDISLWRKVLFFQIKCDQIIPMQNLYFFSQNFVDFLHFFYPISNSSSFTGHNFAPWTFISFVTRFYTGLFLSERSEHGSTRSASYR